MDYVPTDITLYTPTSREFREAVLAMRPALVFEPYYRLYRRLLLYPKEGGDIIVSHHYLSKINKVHPKDFKSHDFLQAFKTDVLPGFEWSDYSYVEERARVVTCTGLCGEDYALLRLHYELKKSVLGENGIYLSSHRLDGYLEDDYSRAIADAARRSEDRKISAEARMIQSYHNGLPSSIFKRLVKPNIECAQAWLDANLEGEAKRQAQDILDLISVTPKPILTPSKAQGDFKAPAARLFEIRPRLGSIRSELRHILMRSPNVFEVDLQSSQLGILAALWSVPELTELLKGGMSIWEHLAQFLDAPKDALKRSLYGVCYGAGKAGLIEELEGQVPDPESFVEAFLAVPTVKLLWDARDRRLKEITDGKAGGEYLRDPLTGRAFYRAPHQELALEAQAVELAIISAVYHVQAEFPDEVTILLYQYDGLTIRFRRQAAVERLKRKIDASVEAEALRWGTETSLIWSPLLQNCTNPLTSLQ